MGMEELMLAVHWRRKGMTLSAMYTSMSSLEHRAVVGQRGVGGRQVRWRWEGGRWRVLGGDEGIHVQTLRYDSAAGAEQRREAVLSISRRVAEAGVQG